MRFRIIRSLKRLLRNGSAQKTYADLLELRQRLFEEQYGKALCLDRYDLISDHIVLYENSGFETPIAYLRSVTPGICQEYDVPLPILSALSHSPLHLKAYRAFEAEVAIPVNMGFLCLDQKYKNSLQGIKIIELLTWVAFQVAGPQPGKTGFCATSNSKFRQNEWLEKIGEIIPGIPQLVHPVIPDPHDLILIPKIRSAYWMAEDSRFRSLLAEAEWIVPGDAPERKRAA